MVSNCSTVYSRFMSSRTLLDPHWTGMWTNAKAWSALKKSVSASSWFSTNGGLVMPKRSIAPEDVTVRSSRKAAKRSVSEVLWSMPYAPVSSDDSHTSTAPSSAMACLARATMSSAAYEFNTPRACRVLQYVQFPKHPCESGMISTSGALRTLGRSRLGSEGEDLEAPPPCGPPDLDGLRRPNSRTVSPLRARSVTSTTLRGRG